MKNGLMPLNNNAEAYVAKLLGMLNTQEPTEPTNVLEEFLNLLLQNGGVIPRDEHTVRLDEIDEVIISNTTKINSNLNKIDANTTKTNSNATEIAKTNSTVAPLVDAIVELEKKVKDLTDRLVALEPPIEEGESEEEVIPPTPPVEPEEAEEGEGE